MLVESIKDDQGTKIMGRASGLSVDRRTEAVLSLLRREEPAGRIARRFGISEQTLYRYRDLFGSSPISGVE